MALSLVGFNFDRDEISPVYLKKCPQCLGSMCGVYAHTFVPIAIVEAMIDQKFSTYVIASQHEKLVVRDCTCLCVSKIPNNKPTRTIPFNPEYECDDRKKYKIKVPDIVRFNGMGYGAYIYPDCVPVLNGLSSTDISFGPVVTFEYFDKCPDFFVELLMLPYLIPVDVAHLITTGKGIQKFLIHVWGTMLRKYKSTSKKNIKYNIPGTAMLNAIRSRLELFNITPIPKVLSHIVNEYAINNITNLLTMKTILERIHTDIIKYCPTIASLH
ncbi:MAG: hypothetical protein Edafosvirus21_14 [Edafosvirus sp.]|uniref:Uncharacterized protein n=1 Tax=Edafosvirus sp. TaxID=2487765 RepID=A0A3G4ZUR1_9VIRU|nr:MAG: hypothetical protein Edafosvirus21_14 [Edafosvirus sp.]